MAEHQAKELRRTQQQGLGRPIISTEMGEHRIVAVGNVVHWSKNWKTFHDFLFDYIKSVFGREWGAVEQKKPLVERHIVMRWNHEIGEYHKEVRKGAPSGKVISTPSTPVLRAYLNLAYNLYLMKHNAELQTALIARLKNANESSFHGAYYETFVAAAFIKAGYDVAFENEQDGSASHCEFAATSKTTKKKFSVEAKSRFRSGPILDASKLKLGVRDKLEAALQKQANHTRVIFIDVNMPETNTPPEKPAWAEPSLAEIRNVEQTMIAAEQDTPNAYVILTNYPYQFDVPGGLQALMEGFNIPEFKLGAQFPSLRAALEARDRHADIAAVFQSMQKHHEIPSTFDGEMPEVKFSSQTPASELKIGQRYLVPNETGAEQPGELENAVVMEPERKAYGVYRMDDNRRVIVSTPLTDDEFAAYKKYPETFFGTVDKNAGRQCRDIIDWYDFFYESYQLTSKEKLLEFMKDAVDLDSLKNLSQEDLAKTYCERLAYGVDRQPRR